MSERKGKIIKNKHKSNPYIKLFFSGAAGTGLFFFLIAAFSLIVMKLNLTESLFMPAGLIFGVLSGFLAGYTSVIPFGEKGLIYGSAGGAVCAVLCGTTAFAVNGGKAGTGIFLLGSIILISSIGGGIISSGKKRKRK